MQLLGSPSIDEPLEYCGRYWGVPGRVFHKDTLYTAIFHYMYLGQKVYVQDTLTVIKMSMMRDTVVEFTLNSIFNKHKDWKLFDTAQGTLDYDIDRCHMHNVIQDVTGVFRNMEYTLETVERFQHFLLKKRKTLVSPLLVREMLKFYRII